LILSRVEPPAAQIEYYSRGNQDRAKTHVREPDSGKMAIIPY